MKLTDYTFPAGMPLSREAFKHQQDGYVEALGATLSALCDPTDGFIVSGCVFPAVTGTVTEGWVYLNREFFWFPGGSLTIPIPTNTCFVIDDLPAAAPLASAVYSDSVTRSPFRTRQVRIAVATSGIRLPLATRRYFNQIVRIGENWRYVNTAGNPNYLSHWDLSVNTLVRYRLLSFNEIELGGYINNDVGTGGVFSTIFQLPVGYRPTIAKGFRLNALEGTFAQQANGAFLRIDTSGNVQFASATVDSLRYTLDGVTVRLNDSLLY